MRPRLIPILAIAGLVIFFVKPFREGWTQPSTDFPNYYTAAVTARHGEPLHSYYNWTWFERQMNYAGVEGQLGAYAAQTPLTMLPLIPLAGASPQTAKRAWLVINLVFLAATIAMLVRITRLRWDWITLLMLSGYGSLASNFVYGQYYVFLLFLMTLTAYCLHRSQQIASGLLAGITFGLKLYTGPLLLYSLVKRKWRCAGGMLAGIAGAALLAIALFGWSDSVHYATRVLPRSLEGGSIDPYNPGNATLATFLRHSLMREPQLNPNPVMDAPWLFFFLLPAVRFALLVYSGLGLAFSKGTGMSDLAWFVVGLLLLSTSVGSYTFLLLLLPTTLLLQHAKLWMQALLVTSYILLNAHLPAVWLFPKVWLLLVLFIVTGRDLLRCIPVRWAVAAALVIVAVSVADAKWHMLNYAREPGRGYPQITSQDNSLLAAYPTITKYGLFYQCTERDRYALCWSHDGRIEHVRAEGQALHPATQGIDGPILFELVAHRTSTMMQFDPSTRTLAPSPIPAASTSADRTPSPDGKWIARTEGIEGSRQIWLEDVMAGKSVILAGGNCDSADPAWEVDSSAVVFASDCGRAYGLSALYRAPVH